MIKGSIQEDVKIINIYAPNIGAPQYIRQMLLLLLSHFIHVRLLVTPWTTAYLPGSSIHGIFQAKVQEWGAIAFSEYDS